MNFSDAFKKLADKYHAHLDECEQCEQHPFELCRIGDKIMKELIEALGQKGPSDDQTQEHR